MLSELDNEGQSKAPPMSQPRPARAGLPLPTITALFGPADLSPTAFHTTAIGAQQRDMVARTWPRRTPNMAADNPILEHLRSIRGTVETTATELGHLQHRVSALERQMAEMQTGIAGVQHRLDYHAGRLGRIERRLEIVNGAAR